MASTVEVILKLTDKFSKEMKGAGKSVKELGKQLKTVAIGIGTVSAGVGLAIKTISQLGGEGGAVIQTAESFDLLLAKVGASPALLGELRDAARGTISDMRLMSSTATLLAGASGELATNLANATPELLEIAKAAQKLNPSLGSTQFLYESIAKGVKRASPLILDNLGIIIKAEEAYSAMAKSLGKTVDALDSGERSQAILNQTLEAGRVLVDQVGGSTDSATDSFQQMDAAIENAANALKAKLAPSLEDAANAVTILLTAKESLRAALIKHEKEVRNNEMAYEDYVGELDRAARVVDLFIDEQGDLRTLTGKLVEENFRLSESERILSGRTINLVGDMFSLGGALPVEEVREFSRTLEEVNESAARLIDESLARLTAPKQIALDLRVTDLSISADLSGFIDKLLFQEAGGDDVARAAMQIKQAILGERITTEEGREFLGELLVIDQATLVEANLQTAKEAAENIAEEFGISFGEAAAQLEAVGDVEGLIGAVTAISNIPEKLAERTQMLELAEGIVKTGEGSEIAAPLIGDLADNAAELQEHTGQAAASTGLLAQAIRSLQSKTITITTNFVTTGSPPVGLGGGAQTDSGRIGGRAAGGSVSAGGMFMVGERGPELFVPSTSGNIVPNNQLGGGGDTFIINQSFHNQGVAALAMDEIWRMRDKRDNQFMGV